MSSISRVLGKKEVEHKLLDGCKFNSESKVRVYTLRYEEESKDLKIGYYSYTAVDNGEIHKALSSTSLGYYRFPNKGMLVKKEKDLGRNLGGIDTRLYFYYRVGNGSILDLLVHEGEYQKIELLDNYLLVYLPNDTYKCYRVGDKGLKDYGLFKGTPDNKGTQISLQDAETEGRLVNLPLDKNESTEIVFKEV